MRLLLILQINCFVTFLDLCCFHTLYEVPFAEYERREEHSPGLFTLGRCVCASERGTGDVINDISCCDFFNNKSNASVFFSAARLKAELCGVAVVGVLQGLDSLDQPLP